jgi:hypothetical protein
MSECEICGNENTKPLKIYFRGAVHTFDGFECAVRALATTCVRCGSKFIKRAGASVAAACDVCVRDVSLSIRA